RPPESPEYLREIVRVAHERTDASHTAGRIDLTHRTSIHSRHRLRAASIPTAGPRCREIHDIRTRTRCRMLEKDSRSTALTGRYGSERRCMLNSQDPGHGVQPPGSKTVTGRHTADFRRVLLHFEDLGAWWPMLDTIRDLTSG